MKKFLISSDALRPALKKLSLAIGSNKILPTLSSIYCIVTKGQVELITTDLELTVSCKVPAESKESFEMLLPFDYINRLVPLFKSSPISIELIDKKRVVITGDGEDYHLNSLADLKTFPEIPTLPVKNVIKLDDDFVDLLNTAMTSIGADESKPALSHVCFDMKTKQSFLVSTDTYVLYKHGIDIIAKEPEQLMISKKFAGALDGLKDIELSWTKEKIAVKNSVFTIWSTRFDGKYVNYDVVIPKEITPNLKINRQDLIDALIKACLNSEATKQTHLFLKRDEGKIHIEYNDADLERKGHIVIAGEYTGDVEAISVGAKKLLIALNQTDKDEITFNITGPTRAVLIAAEEDKGYLGLIMPLMINQSTK